MDRRECPSLRCDSSERSSLRPRGRSDRAIEPGPTARGSRSVDRLRGEGRGAVRRLYIVRSRGPALRRRRPNHLHGCGRAWWEGARERTLFSKHINIIPKVNARGYGRPGTWRRRWPGVTAGCGGPKTAAAGELPALRRATVRTGDRRGYRSAKVQAANACVGRFVERPAGVSNALHRRIGAAQRPSRRCWACGRARVLVGARAPALAQAVGESRSHASRNKDSAHG
jgi:hypothetical protein